MAAKKENTKLDTRNSESLGDDAYEWLIAAITSFRIPTNSQISENGKNRQIMDSMSYPGLHSIVDLFKYIKT